MNFNFNGQEYTIQIWDGQYLGEMVCIDTETEMVDKWTNTPQLSTFQAYGGGAIAYYVRVNDIQRFLDLHTESTLLAQNMPFDCDVIHKELDNKCIFNWYDKDLIRDTKILYQLLHLATSGSVPFKTSLDFLTEKFLGVVLEKDIEVRGGFGQFIGKPIESIPEKFLVYGIKDVIATFQVHNKLMEYIARHDVYNTLLSQHIQVKGDLALNHMYKNGIGFDIEGRDVWLTEKDVELKSLSLKLSDWGLMRGVAGYKATYKHIIEDLLKIEVPYRYKKLHCIKHKDVWVYAESGMIDIKGRITRVEEGQTCHGEPSISSQKDDLLPYMDQPFVADYVEFQSIEKATSFVRNIDSDMVHPRYNTIVNTGRTSCSAPNFQNLPKMGGIREMFRAQEGNTFIITDYAAVELATLSQVLYNKFGESVMKDKINEGHDLHKYYASVMNSIPISMVTKEQRQEAKAANFGFPGGLGAKTFIQFSRGYGLDLTEGEARNMKQNWFDAYPETRNYMQDEIGHVFTLTGRKRGRTTYCAEKNTPFQGLAADGAKIALYNLVRQGFKVVGFVHDEIICEVKSDRANEDLVLQEKIMIESMQQVCPDVLIGVESAISEFYTK